ncbi:Amidophosphoribosyltransferase [subsurface metagenome]
MPGVFGIKSKRECINDLLTGIFSLQHRGEGFCGAVTKTKKGLVSYRYEGKVDDSFAEKEKKRLTGSYGLGSVHPFYKQPISFESGFGELSLSYSGKILNKRSLRNHLLKKGHSLSIKQTDAEIIGKLITEKNEATNIVEGLKRMASQVRGIYSLGILAEDGLYAFRSPVGVEPLVVGSNNDISAFSSESCSLKELWLRENEYRTVGPGEIIYIGDKGIETVGQLNGMKALHQQDF